MEADGRHWPAALGDEDVRLVRFSLTARILAGPGITGGLLDDVAIALSEMR
jgi:hypothetical protein